MANIKKGCISMSGSVKINYNLPGYGFASCLLFGIAQDLYSILEESQLLEKLKNTYQLGTMRFVYPGAHHTRYEYVFTQLMLISNIVTTKDKRNIELSLGSDLHEYGITGGEALQCLAMLVNAGHMYDTFTASRMMLSLLLESQKNKTDFYAIYYRNLPQEIRTTFKEALKKGDYYKLHLYNMIHILNGLSHKSSNRDQCKIFLKLLMQFINPTLITNEATKRIFELYKKIRKIAYLSVDMIYTPASFGANLSRMIYSISSYVDDLFDIDSPLNKSIQQLEDIIHKQIYDSALCIINSSRIVQERQQEYIRASQQVKNAYLLRHMILEDHSPFTQLQVKHQPLAVSKLTSASSLLLNIDYLPSIDLHLITDQLLQSLPFTRIAFGSQIAQNFQRYYFAFGLIAYTNLVQDTQTIISKIVSLQLYNNSEKDKLVLFAVKSIYQYNEYFFNLVVPPLIDKQNCIFIGKGTKHISNLISQYIGDSSVSEKFTKDELHEIEACISVLSSISYTGSVICYIGGIKASRYSSTTKTDELDGFIYFPTRPVDQPIAIIVEAKNYNHGSTDARKQLEGTVRFLEPKLNHNIVELPDTNCAYLELSLSS